MPGQTPPTNEVLQMLQEGKSQQQISSELQQQGYNMQQINDAINQANIKSEVVSGNVSGQDMQQPSDEMRISAISQEPEDIPVPTPTAKPEPQQEAPPAYDQQQYAQQPQQQYGQQQDYGNYPMGGPEQQAGYDQQAYPPQMNYAYEDIQSLVEEVIDEKWKDFLSSMGDIVAWKSQMGDEVEAIKQEILRTQNRFDNLQSAILGKVDDYGKNVKDIGSEMKALEKVFEKILEPLTDNVKELSKITKDLRKKGK